MCRPKIDRSKKWIGVTSEVKNDVNIPMGHSWGYERTIRDVSNAPFEAIEKYAKPFRMVFGMKRETPADIREALRYELMRRCREGEYIFSGYAERKRMHRQSTTLVRI